MLLERYAISWQVTNFLLLNYTIATEISVSIVIHSVINKQLNFPALDCELYFVALMPTC